ncbi:hypothetical protein PFLUV_G00165150 [Perca fluviatilis]|uniref:Uncharacterized protein n=1 Tax=Perca fluviatilis TaxID=8168 RepID=A0A6A5EWU8_PERFL|nr:hypothetical protein PFLUV_G00165150 [Perca fluviatilis]
MQLGAQHPLHPFLPLSLQPSPGAFNYGPVFGIRKALLFSDFERRKKGLLWNFLRNLFGQLRYRGFAFYRLGT